MFNFFKKQAEQEIVIGSPVGGKAVPLSEVNDPTFGGEILGKGIAVIPRDGRIYAPADGNIDLLFDTKHAFSMTTNDGAEVLVHIGLNTIKLKGEHFKAHAATGNTVNKGDLVITADLEAIAAEGYDVITSVIICNTSEYVSVEALSGREVDPGNDVLKLRK